MRWRGSYRRGGTDGSLNLWETSLLFFINLCRAGDVLEYHFLPSTGSEGGDGIGGVDGEETCSPGRFQQWDPQALF